VSPRLFSVAKVQQHRRLFVVTEERAIDRSDFNPAAACAQHGAWLQAGGPRPSQLERIASCVHGRRAVLALCWPDPLIPARSSPFFFYLKIITASDLFQFKSTNYSLMVQITGYNFSLVPDQFVYHMEQLLYQNNFLDHL
jgi:hypothetical protein